MKRLSPDEILDLTILELAQQSLLRMETIMSVLDDLSTAVANLTTAIDAKLAEPPAGTPDEALQPIVDEVNAQTARLEPAPVVAPEPAPAEPPA